jgi:hypothetical protein
MRDQLAEDAAAVRELADLGVRRLVDPAREEPRELLSRLAENAQCGVARASQLLRRPHDALEHGVQVQLGEDAPRDLEHPEHSPVRHLTTFRPLRAIVPGSARERNGVA